MVLKINRQSRVVNAGMKCIHDGLSSFSWVQLAEFFLLQELARISFLTVSSIELKKASFEK